MCVPGGGVRVYKIQRTEEDSHPIGTPVISFSSCDARGVGKTGPPKGFLAAHKTEVHPLPNRLTGLTSHSSHRSSSVQTICVSSYSYSSSVSNHTNIIQQMSVFNPYNIVLWYRNKTEIRTYRASSINATTESVVTVPSSCRGWGALTNKNDSQTLSTTSFLHFENVSKFGHPRHN